MPSRESILSIGKYEVVEAVGSGGMATVYRARLSGPMGFEKPVAVKVLQDDAAADDEIVRMFVDEARLGARLSHPNIAHVLEFGEADGRYFLAMEYVDGMSLSSLLKRGAKGKKNKGLGVAATAWATDAVLRALSYAHGQPGPDGKALGVVHRDVSPQNVLLDRNGAVKLCDFGIATGAWRAERTRAGVVKGKAGYMAPEQAAGGKVDARTDLYAVALTAVAMLTGAPPYDGRDTGEVRAKAARGLPPEVVDGLPVPEEMREVLRRALAPRPGDRWADAEAMRKALRAAVPDPGEEGRAALAAAVEAAAGRPGVRSSARRASGARVDRGTAARGAGASSATGLKVLVAGAGLLLLAALVLALLKQGLPQ